jgi:hypothetical protein
MGGRTRLVIARMLLSMLSSASFVSRDVEFLMGSVKVPP